MLPCSTDNYDVPLPIAGILWLLPRALAHHIYAK